MGMNSERARRPLEGVPNAELTVHIRRVGDNMLEALYNCAEMCLADPDPRSLDYDCKEDLLIYHYHVHEMDRAAYPILNGTDEIWIVTDPMKGVEN